MRAKKNYMFTNKEHPVRGIMSFLLGIISIISIILAVFFTFQNKGVAAFNYGIVVLLATLFSIVGLTLGILAKTEKDKYYFFCYMGMILNFIGLVMISGILYVGAYGI